jgi:autonomous glycyl radical cofactor GrcA
MNSKLLVGLLLASSLSFGLAASVSTLAEREVLIKEAFAKSPEDAVEAINKSQQEEKIKVDDQHYVVVIKKDGDKYIRVAHFKKEKINQAVEQSIMNVMQDAEAKLAGGSGPVAFDFSASEKKLFAVLSKQGNFLVFNICPAEDEVKGLLAAGEKSAEVKSEEVKPEVKPEVKQEEVKPADATVAPVATPAPAVDAPAVAPEKTADKPVDTAVAAPAATPAPVTDSAKSPAAAAA